MLLGLTRNVLRYTDPPPPAEKFAEMAMHMFVKGFQPNGNGRVCENGGARTAGQARPDSVGSTHQVPAEVRR